MLILAISALQLIVSDIYTFTYAVVHMNTEHKDTIYGLFESSATVISPPKSTGNPSYVTEHMSKWALKLLFLLSLKVGNLLSLQIVL